ncbi:hypothetical protein D9619_002573 [Psilocybe cf. subviscida]|uniref:Uncharacterized protein n=1 Tax=Psilocybe cf. subviscida TaxID=2480587 RepID=A0A8H5AXW5_9AGAR|nr:hypothetical protein D9619_002573 [Psilocybe cf. subviscida]
MLAPPKKPTHWMLMGRGADDNAKRQNALRVWGHCPKKHSHNKTVADDDISGAGEASEEHVPNAKLLGRGVDDNVKSQSGLPV